MANHPVEDNVNKLVGEIYGKDPNKGQELIVDMHTELTAKYGQQARQCLALSKAIGSTPRDADLASAFPDFSGNDSVVERLKQIKNSL